MSTAYLNWMCTWNACQIYYLNPNPDYNTSGGRHILHTWERWCWTDCFCVLHKTQRSISGALFQFHFLLECLPDFKCAKSFHHLNLVEWKGKKFATVCEWVCLRVRERERERERVKVILLFCTSSIRLIYYHFQTRTISLLVFKLLC